MAKAQPVKVAVEISVRKPGDWTMKDGVSNSSDEYNDLVVAVEHLIRDGGGYVLSSIWARHTARLIVSQLAHVHDVGPLS